MKNKPHVTAIKNFLIDLLILISILAIITGVIMTFTISPKLTTLLVIKIYCGIASFSYSDKELQLPQFPTKKQMNKSMRKSLLYFLVFPLLVCCCDYFIILDLIARL